MRGVAARPARGRRRVSGYRTDAAIATGNGWTIVENASLEGRNTFRVKARADLLVDIHDDAALEEIFAFRGLAERPVLVLGEGSNLLFAGDWPGIVLSMATRGIEVVEDDGVQALVRVAAGENWNDFVHWSLAHGFAGLENLVLIPGTVGAAPIQNIGAYGVEVGDAIAGVHLWDRRDRVRRHLARDDCAFAYRDSLFKRDAERLLVVAVDFRLDRRPALRLDYAGIVTELERLGDGPPTPRRVAEAVARLRMRKLPNPAVIGNAGSFFKNPLVDADTAAALHAAHPELPQWPAAAGQVKLSAAWLIEACGLKGWREGDAGVSAQHALVLVNHGRASGAELWNVARHVVDGVRARFGIALEPEPRIIGG
ncbi:MAG: UDP-N-acetylmuramate dehydrogenase [Xanthomonadales bacterium]|nr:UDP-N-acetylmuramate dehydrogenase [Xanthomonadales bacterium]